MKQCKKCNNLLNNNLYHVDKTSKDGLYRWCKNCKKKYDKKYRQSDKVINYQKSKEYKDKKIIYKNSNYLKIKISNLKHSALKRNLQFLITEKDIKIVTHCPLLGIELDYEVGKGRKNWNAASIDRIDNNKGYIPGNVWILSKLANTMKFTASIKELKKFSKNILKTFK